MLLYATSRPTSTNENQQIDRSEKANTSDEVGDSDSAMVDADDNVENEVDEADLGGFAQLSVVEAMLDRGQGLEAGLQGVAMTRYFLRLLLSVVWCHDVYYFQIFNSFDFFCLSFYSFFIPLCGREPSICRSVK